MYLHQKLDWNISRLEKQLRETPDNPSLRLEYAECCLSMAQFHRGGEVWFNRSLTQARRVLQHDPNSPGAMIVAGMSLVGLDRVEPASRYLDEALRLAPERPDVHYGLGALYRLNGNRHQAVKELEVACRLAPKSWEPNEMLGKLLAERAEEFGSPRRLMERSQFHTVRALQLGPSLPMAGSLIHRLALTCLQMGRLDEAHKLFLRLRDIPDYSLKAKYFLGLVAFRLGKYKNAVLYLRQHLEQTPDNPHVLAKIGMAYLHLGEIVNAREACNRALALEPSHIGAQWTLGCAMLEEGRSDDAVKVFKNVLAEAPDHISAFHELVRIRMDQRDWEWVHKALRAEVGVHDRLPVCAERRDPTSGQVVTIRPRSSTRERVRILLDVLANSPQDVVSMILETMDLTSDEGLRFQLWEAALHEAAAHRLHRAAESLAKPGEFYSAEAAREVLSLATMLPEELLTMGLNLTEDDLRRAAINRNGPANDVTTHREAVESQREQARAWQALLLLSIAARKSHSAKTLLLRWASDADPELSDAAKAALIMLGDTDFSESLRKRAQAAGCEGLVDHLMRISTPATAFKAPSPVSSDKVCECSICGVKTAEAGHLLQGNRAIICDGCITMIAQRRRDYTVDNSSCRCSLCDTTLLKSRSLYAYRGVHVCADCVDHSLGLVEREEVNRYLSSL
jgi:tetratricopeptide (TPR) repeat protein